MGLPANDEALGNERRPAPAARRRERRALRQPRGCLDDGIIDPARHPALLGLCLAIRGAGRRVDTAAEYLRGGALVSVRDPRNSLQRTGPPVLNAMTKDNRNEIHPRTPAARRYRRSSATRNSTRTIAEWEAAGHFQPPKYSKKLGNLGLLGLKYPEELCGAASTSATAW